MILKASFFCFVLRGFVLLMACDDHHCAQYASAFKKLLFWLRLAPYFLSNFSTNAQVQFLIGRRGAKRQILEFQIRVRLILERRSMRLFFLERLPKAFTSHMASIPHCCRVFISCTGCSSGRWALKFMSIGMVYITHVGRQFPSPATGCRLFPAYF